MNFQRSFVALSINEASYDTSIFMSLYQTIHDSFTHERPAFSGRLFSLSALQRLPVTLSSNEPNFHDACIFMTLHQTRK